MFEVINTVSEKDIKDEFVAIGSYINDTKIPFHSVIIIKYNNETLQYHYTGYDISYDNYIDKDCFHKITNTINEKLIPSFIAMCKRVLKTATPRYGFFYSGEYYDINGNHFSEKPVGETMTCAGFCINILKGFLETDYLVYQDWNPSSHPTVDYLENYSSRYGLEKDKIEESHRRISPLELLCSGFFSDLPIRKHQIDTKTDIIQDYFNNY